LHPPRGFSGRVPPDLSPNRLSTALARLREAGAPGHDLTLSNPTRAGLRFPGAEFEISSSGYDPDPRGSLRAREAILALYAERGVDLTSRDLFLASSTSEAYGWIFKLLGDPGDEVLVPRPSYPLFDHLARLESLVPRTWPLREEGEWSVDLAALEGAITPRTCALVVVNPNNPTGSYLRRSEAAAIQSLCHERGLALVSDEVFADYALAPRPEAARTLGRAAGAGPGPLTFLLDGLSKTLAMPQMKLSWIALQGEAARRTQAAERLEFIADTYLPVSAPVQEALPRLLARRAEFQAPVLDRVRRNLDRLREVSGPGSICRLLPVEAGWSAVLRVPSFRTGEDWCLTLLEHDGLLVHPGHFFDFDGEAHLVLGLLPEPDAFRDGIGRLVARIERESSASQPPAAAPGAGPRRP
jgi:aspartate/methionine/tyrosine aminotransferase